MTIETLARITAKGFEDTATKADITGVRHEMHAGFRVVTDTLDLIRSDIRDLKISVEIDLKDLKHRVERLEKKVGLNA